MPRVFLAIPLPEDVRTTLCFAGGGIPDARWVAADSMHLTIHFLGDVEGRALRSLVDAVVAFEADDFEVQLSSVGTFPLRGRPRVLWAGIGSGRAELQALHADLADVLGRLGFDLESRKYAPHVTLARFPRPPANAALSDWVAHHATMESRPFRAERVLLYSSVLNPGGARYSVEAGARLRASGPE